MSANEMCADATFRCMPHEAIGRHAVATADPLPNGLDELRLFAAAIIRHVRANRGTASASSPVTGSTSTSTPSSRVGQAMRSTPCGPVDRLRTILDGGASVSIDTLFAELACRRVHALATEEGRHECHESSIDALRSPRVCLRAAVHADTSAGKSREHGTAISAPDACDRPGMG